VLDQPAPRRQEPRDLCRGGAPRQPRGIRETSFSASQSAIFWAGVPARGIFQRRRAAAAQAHGLP
jgi:hypothetical protein